MEHGFQNYNPASSSLESLSQTLKSSNVVSRGATSDKDHLEPKALQSLYIRLMKEEIKLENQKNDSYTQLPREKHESRRQKLSSPVLETMEEVSHYSRLLPQLATRVYDSYRESAIKSIGDEELTYRRLQKDIQEIERGEWDARLQQQETTSRRDPKALSSIQTLLHNEPDSSQARSTTVNGTSPAPLPSNYQPFPDTGTPPRATPNAHIWENQSKVVPNTNGHQRSTPSIDPASAPKDLAAVAAGSPTRARQPIHPPHEHPSNTPRPSSQSTSADNGVPFLPPPQPSQQPTQQAYHVISTDQAQYLLPDHRRHQVVHSTKYSFRYLRITHIEAISTLHTTAAHLTKMPMHPTIQLRCLLSIRTTIPTLRHISTPHMLLANLRITLHGLHINNLYMLTRMGSPYAPYPPPSTLEQQTALSAPDGRRKHPKPSPINTSLSSTKWKNTSRPRGFRSPKSPIRPRADEISPISDRAPSPAFENPGFHGPTIGGHADFSSSTRRNLRPPSDPRPTVKPRRGRPPRGTATRGRGTRAPSTASSTFPTRTRSASAVSGADELSLEPPTTVANRPTIKPEPVATPARESSASMPPSATTDNEGNRKSTRRRRGTLRGMESAAESTRTSTKRKRTATDASELGPPFPVVTSAAFDKQREQLSATHILASRNLPRTSATLINDITAHKLASIFAKPITEREAPGYHSLIFRPQDLKSIKQAITNGNKALTSLVDEEHAGENDDAVVPVAGAGESDMRVWVRRNEDVVPPKGIVNSVQLEREIVRVFANAVMFSPNSDRGLGPAFRTRAKGIKERHVPAHLADEEDEEEDGEGRERKREEEEGGVVRDAREMFEDVERVVREWRAAEKAAEEAASVKAGVNVKGVEDEEEADELAGESSGGVKGEEEEGAGGREIWRPSMMMLFVLAEQP
ncbi:MAG: hypothetical protein LQ345_001869 [Seirophora villosa]|nr:MAG: hypothetical protein LQ345_001869 [Seirophora villosa]